MINEDKCICITCCRKKAETFFCKMDNEHIKENIIECGNYKQMREKNVWRSPNK
jgi:hypothetical protein